MESFTGIWVPLVTPFRADGAIDHAALRALTLHLAPHVAGFVVCGSTGEAHALSDDEQLAALDTVCAAAPDTRIVFGLGGPRRAHLHTQIAALRTHRLAGLLVTPPYYVRPSQMAIVEYFLDLADASPWPLIAYNIPYRTGVAMTLPTFEAIASHPNIRAVKDCGGDPALTLDLITRTPLTVLAGEDGNILATLGVGGGGAIAASAHLFPARFAAMFKAVGDGRSDDARAIFHGLWPLIRTLFEEPNPAGIKAALAAQGWCERRCRAPMQAASDALAARLATMVTAAMPDARATAS